MKVPAQIRSLLGHKVLIEWPDATIEGGLGGAVGVFTSIAIQSPGEISILVLDWGFGAEYRPDVKVSIYHRRTD